MFVEHLLDLTKDNLNLIMLNEKGGDITSFVSQNNPALLQLHLLTMQASNAAIKQANYLLNLKMSNCMSSDKQVIQIVCQSQSTGLEADPIGSGLPKLQEQSIQNDCQSKFQQENQTPCRKINKSSQSKRVRKSKCIEGASCHSSNSLSDCIKRQLIERKSQQNISQSEKGDRNIRQKIFQQFSGQLKESYSPQKPNFITTTDQYTNPSFVAQLRGCLGFSLETNFTSNQNISLHSNKPKETNVLFYHKKLTRASLRPIRSSRSTESQSSSEDLERFEVAKYRYRDPEIFKLIGDIYNKIGPTSSFRRSKQAVVEVNPSISGIELKTFRQEIKERLAKRLLTSCD